MPKQRADRIRPSLQSDGVTPALPAIGDAITAANVSGAPGCPAIDGSRLLNLDGGFSREAPGEHFLGNFLSYPSRASISAGVVQYTRIYLLKDTVIANMRASVQASGAAGRLVRMGIYNNHVGGVVTPASAVGVPGDKVAETGQLSTASFPNFLTGALTSNYTVPTTGYYWVAFTITTSGVQFVCTAAPYQAGYLPRREQSGVSPAGSLPTTAGSLTNPASAVFYVAAVETGF